MTTPLFLSTIKTQGRNSHAEHTNNRQHGLHLPLKGRNRTQPQTRKEAAAATRHCWLTRRKFEMVHNDVELRCLWLCKVDGQDEPVQVWMDNGFKAIKKHTDTVPATEGGE